MQMEISDKQSLACVTDGKNRKFLPISWDENRHVCLGMPLTLEYRKIQLSTFTWEKTNINAFLESNNSEPSQQRS